MSSVTSCCLVSDASQVHVCVFVCVHVCVCVYGFFIYVTRAYRLTNKNTPACSWERNAKCIPKCWDPLMVGASSCSVCVLCMHVLCEFVVICWSSGRADGIGAWLDIIGCPGLFACVRPCLATPLVVVVVVVVVV